MLSWLGVFAMSGLKKKTRHESRPVDILFIFAYVHARVPLVVPPLVWWFVIVPEITYHTVTGCCFHAV